MSDTKITPRRFLKTLGFELNKQPAALDRAFLKTFSSDDQEEVKLTWETVHAGFAPISALYALPQTDKQASLLFSQDAKRYERSLSWFSQVVAKRAPKLVVEAGCGAGYLLRYLRYLHPDLELVGIDRSENLVNLLDADKSIEALAEDYNETDRRYEADLVISDFGWDATDIPPSQSPHSSASLGGEVYCPGCSNDSVPFFAGLVRSLSSFASPTGAIAMMGRFPGMGPIRALVVAAEEQGWHIDADAFEVVIMPNPHAAEGREKFPAFVLTRSENTKAPLQLEEIGEIYGGRG